MHAYTLMLTAALSLAIAASAAAQNMASVYVPSTAAPAGSSTSRAAAAGDPFAARPDTYGPRYGGPTDLPPRPFGYGFTDAFLPSGLMFLIPAGTPSDRPATGALQLRIQPAHAEVFIDGGYAGTAADFAHGDRTLEAGPHAIEVRAAGYETHRFDRRIIEGDTSLYRYDLWRVRPAPVSPNAALVGTVSVPRPYYVITGCYGGNRPPVASQLPAGCHIDQVRTLEYMVRVPARSPVAGEQGGRGAL
jgi:hypothetical protein